MFIFKKHLELGPPLKISKWRKIATGLWSSPTEGSVYSLLEMELTPVLAYLEKQKSLTQQKLTLTHFVGKAFALLLRDYPQLNCVLRFGKFYPRKSIDIFFQVASDPHGHDLSGLVINNADQKSLAEIAAEMQKKAATIRNHDDLLFKKIKNLLSTLPVFLVGKVISFSSFCLYSLNLWSPLFGVPKNPYGGLMITNIGSLGLDFTFVPLIPSARVPIIVALGVRKEKLVMNNGVVEKRPVCGLYITFDHRFMDGLLAGKMVKTLEKIFSQPEKELPDHC